MTINPFVDERLSENIARAINATSHASQRLSTLPPNDPVVADVIADLSYISGLLEGLQFYIIPAELGENPDSRNFMQKLRDIPRKILQ